jgi:hypothetical protein
VQAERPPPGAQVPFTDIYGHRLVCLATDVTRGRLLGLQLRHRRHARCEDWIGGAKDMGLCQLPLHGFAQNQIWSAVRAWSADCQPGPGAQLPFFVGQAHRWEFK